MEYVWLQPRQNLAARPVHPLGRRFGRHVRAAVTRADPPFGQAHRRVDTQADGAALSLEREVKSLGVRLARLHYGQQVEPTAVTLPRSAGFQGPRPRVVKFLDRQDCLHGAIAPVSMDGHRSYAAVSDSAESLPELLQPWLSKLNCLRTSSDDRGQQISPEALKPKGFSI